MKQEISLRLSPSKIGQYYEKRCDKNLVTISLNDKDIEKLGWSKRVEELSAAATAGNLWEREICKDLRENSEIQFVEIPQFSDDKTKGIDKTVEALKQLRSRRIVRMIRLR